MKRTRFFVLPFVLVLAGLICSQSANAQSATLSVTPTTVISPYAVEFSNYISLAPSDVNTRWITMYDSENGGAYQIVVQATFNPPVLNSTWEAQYPYTIGFPGTHTFYDTDGGDKNPNGYWFTNTNTVFVTSY